MRYMPANASTNAWTLPSFAPTGAVDVGASRWVTPNNPLPHPVEGIVSDFCRLQWYVHRNRGMPNVSQLKGDVVFEIGPVVFGGPPPRGHRVSHREFPASAKPHMRTLDKYSRRGGVVGFEFLDVPRSRIVQAEAFDTFDDGSTDWGLAAPPHGGTEGPDGSGTVRRSQRPDFKSRGPTVEKTRPKAPPPPAPASEQFRPAKAPVTPAGVKSVPPASAVTAPSCPQTPAVPPIKNEGTPSSGSTTSEVSGQPPPPPPLPPPNSIEAAAAEVAEEANQPQFSAEVEAPSDQGSDVDEVQLADVQAQIQQAENVAGPT